MPAPTPLPSPLRHGPFSRRQATDAGVTDSRLRAADLHRPFHGARIPRSLDVTVVTQAQAYAARMPPSQFLSHTTAARLHGMPLPTRWERDNRLHVAAPTTSGYPRAAGVIGHHLDDAVLVEIAGVRVTAPVATWCDLAGLLTVDELVAAGDFLITGTEPYDGVTPLASHEQLARAVSSRIGRRGIRRLRQALPLIRYGSLSPKETELRLLIVRAGLPEPVPNYVLRDGRGVFVAVIDLAFAEWKVGIEYQSDLHRERAQFRRDIGRRERIEDEGWSVIYVSADDLRGSPRQTIDRIRRRLAGRRVVE